METVSVLENSSVLENPDSSSTILTEVNSMDFFARLEEKRKEGVTWSKIILNDGRMGWLESKKTFTWRPLQIGHSNIYCTSLEEENRNEKILLSIGSTIHIVANDPKTLIRYENNKLGELSEQFKIKRAPKGSPMVLVIITGIVCVISLYFYCMFNNINIGATFSQPRIFMGIHPKYFFSGIFITGFVMYSSYWIYYLMGSAMGEAGGIFSKIRKVITREIKIRK